MIYIYEAIELFAVNDIDVGVRFELIVLKIELLMSYKSVSRKPVVGLGRTVEVSKPC